MATDQQVWVHGAKCDGCGKAIEGKFQTCSTCGTYDLCSKCFPRRAELHPEHKQWQRRAAAARADHSAGRRETCSEHALAGRA
eukprot:5045976-Alexandrium_andersonii.AAC.1